MMMLQRHAACCVSAAASSRLLPAAGMAAEDHSFQLLLRSSQEIKRVPAEDAARSSSGSSAEGAATVPDADTFEKNHFYLAPTSRLPLPHGYVSPMISTTSAVHPVNGWLPFPSPSPSPYCS